MKLKYLPIVLGLIIIIFDSVSKYYVQHYLPLTSGYSFSFPYGGIGIFSNFFGIEFAIIHAVNKGIAWGALPSYQYAILYLRIFLIIGLTGYLLFFNREPYYQIPLALIISGAIGNVIDYFMYGHVVDMFLFVFWGYHYPVFNIADSTIFLGVCAFIFISMIKKSSLEKENSSI